MNQYAFLACNIPRTLLILTYARAGAAARRAVGMRLANTGPTYESVVDLSIARHVHDTQHTPVGSARFDLVDCCLYVLYIGLTCLSACLPQRHVGASYVVS